MKKIINLKKEIPFEENISNITSISLDYTMKENQEEIEGVFLIEGSYKTHELSLNKKEFKFEIPFNETIENLKENTANIEVEDFTYDFAPDNLTIDIDYELTYEENDESDEFNEEEFERFLQDHEVDIVNLKEEPQEEVRVDEEDLEDNKEELNEEEFAIESNVDDEAREISIIPEEDDSDADALPAILNNLNKEEKYITYHVYVCENDDTLESISEKFQTTKEEIREYNDIDDIEYGRKIIIPVKDE